MVRSFLNEYFQIFEQFYLSFVCFEWLFMHKQKCNDEKEVEDLTANAFIYLKDISSQRVAAN